MYPILAPLCTTVYRFYLIRNHALPLLNRIAEEHISYMSYMSYILLIGYIPF